MVPTLIVDPDTERHRLYQDVLGKSFKLQFADGMQTGLAAFDAMKPVLMIVVADLPEGSGIVLCKTIREKKTRQPKILLAGDDLDDAILGKDTARNMGADDLMKIPFPADKLRSKVIGLVQELALEQKRKSELPVQAAPTPPAEEPVLAPTLFDRKMDASFDAKAVYPDLDNEQREAMGDERLFLIHYLFGCLDNNSYYNMLGVTPDMDFKTIRSAYYKHSKIFHPDRYSLVKSDTVKTEVSAVFKRISEAYKVLSKQKQRDEYDDLFEEIGAVRLIKTEREVDGPRAKDVEIKNPQARKFYNLAISALGDNNPSSAKMNLQFALSMAPNDPVILEKMAEVKSILESS